MAADITRALHRSWYYDPNTIQVSAQGGKIKLTGNVTSWNARDLAGTTAWSAPARRGKRHTRRVLMKIPAGSGSRAGGDVPRPTLLVDRPARRQRRLPRFPMTPISNAPMDRRSSKSGVDDQAAKTYLVGGGIASMSAGGVPDPRRRRDRCNITILEESGIVGGSLDGSGSAEKGYVLRGGRMFESKYVCTFELFSSIPTLAGGQTLTQEILAWNETMKTSSKSRLMVHGRREDAPKLGLSERQILTIERLALEPEAALGRSRIVDQFDPAFFKTDFWLM